MKEFFNSPWTSGILVGVIMLIVFVVHAGQQSQEHDDRISFNNHQLVDLKAEHKEDVAKLQSELKELALDNAKQSDVINEVRLDFVRIETRLEAMNSKLDKLLDNGTSK